MMLGRLLAVSVMLVTVGSAAAGLALRAPEAAGYSVRRWEVGGRRREGRKETGGRTQERRQPGHGGAPD
jgi:hypothetical protein